MAGSYVCVLHIALAREDSAAADAAVSVLEQCFSSEQVNARALLAAYREDDSRHLDFEPTSDEWTMPILMFLTDRGIPAPRVLIARLRALHSTLPIDMWIYLLEIAEALEDSDLVGLTRAIDEAEDHSMIAQVARLRIVLAERTGDRTQLERARLMLEQHGDRQFLRRLEEVAAALDNDYWRLLYQNSPSIEITNSATCVTILDAYSPVVAILSSCLFRHTRRE